jgi:hypothetical protein
MFNMYPLFYLGVFLYIVCAGCCYFLNVRYLFLLNYGFVATFVEFAVIYFLVLTFISPVVK